MARIAFLCYKNPALALIATGLAESICGEQHQISAATVESIPMVHAAVKAMAESNIDILGQRCRSLSVFLKRPFDLIIVLENEALSYCSDLPGRETVLHWELPDKEPADVEACREWRDMLSKKVSILFTEGYLETILTLKGNQESILDDFPDGIIVHDLNRRISFFNIAAEKITGYSRNQILGRDCHEVFSGGFCAGKCSFCDGKPDPEDKFEYSLNLSDREGRPKKLEMSVSCIRNANGHIQGVLACFRDETEVSDLRKRLHNITHFEGIIGRDAKMQAIYQLIQDLGESDCSVLIQGESGTGKELVANAIHGESVRAGKPFISVNCGALPEGVLESELFGHVKGAFTGAIRDKKGRFELANGGTLFLDEVAELTPNMQVKLLRVLQEGTFEPVGGEKTIQVDVRILSATNRNLREMARQGEFREDLFYRLCVVPIELPPLRQRRTDIPLLIDHFIGLYNERHGRQIESMSNQAMELLLDHAWTGNIRELQNAIQYAFVKCKNRIIEPEHLPMEISGRTGTYLDIKLARRKRKRKLDIAQVHKAMEEVNGNKAEAARVLGIGRATLYRILRDQRV